MDLLDAPCIFCEYDGKGYWQEGTHKKECPWYEVGGHHERNQQLTYSLSYLQSVKLLPKKKKTGKYLNWLTPNKNKS